MPQHTVYTGPRLSHGRPSALEMNLFGGWRNTADPSLSECSTLPVLGPRSTLDLEWVVKHSSIWSIPEYYLPTENMGLAARHLAHVWSRLLLALHQLFDHCQEFSVGWIFDDRAEAQYERSAHGVAFYLNPAVRTVNGCCVDRFKPSDKDRLLAVAAHEFCHSLCPGEGHNDRYAARLTEVFATVIKNRRVFNHCFAKGHR